MKKAVQEKLMLAGRITAYVVFAIVVFVTAFRVSFPVSVLTELMRKQAQAHGVYLSVGEAALSGLSGIELKDLAVGPRNQKFRVHLDRFEAGVGLLSLIGGSPHIGMEMEAGAGHIGPVDVVVKKDVIDVNVQEIKDFPLNKVPVKIGKLSTVIKSGKGNFQYSRKAGMFQSKGLFELETRHTALLNPSVKIPGFGDFKLTSMDLGKVMLKLEIGRRAELKALRKYRGLRSSERVINLSRLIIDGRDLKLLASPTSTLTIPRRGSLVNGQLNLEVAFHIMNAFFGKKTKIDGKLEQPNIGVRTLLSMDMKWKRAFYKGFYGLICTGTLRHPRCFPKRTSQKIGYFHLKGSETKPPKPMLNLGKPESKEELPRKKKL